MSIRCLMNGLEVNYPCSPACALFGDCTTAFEAQKKAKVVTFADKIRSMSDEELTAAIFQLIYATDPATWFCKGKKECGDLMDADEDIPDEMCKACLLAKLRQPAEEVLPCG